MLRATIKYNFLFFFLLAQVHVPQNQYCQSCLYPRGSFSLKIIHRFPARTSFTGLKIPTTPVEPTGGSHPIRGPEGRWKRSKRLRFFFFFFYHPSMEAISHGVGSEVSIGYAWAHCFPEIKLIWGGMIKNVENGCQRGETQISGAG